MDTKVRLLKLEQILSKLNVNASQDYVIKSAGGTSVLYRSGDGSLTWAMTVNGDLDGLVKGSFKELHGMVQGLGRTGANVVIVTLRSVLNTECLRLEKLLAKFEFEEGVLA